jgi:solute carrier family 30 (zinc transporter), member 5/7
MCHQMMKQGAIRLRRVIVVVSLLNFSIRKWITKTEAISSVLVPLPYILASMAFGAHSPVQRLPQFLAVGPLSRSLLESISNRSAKVPTTDDEFFSGLVLTSLTLLLVGLRGKISGPPTMLDRRKHSSSKKDKVISAKGRQIIERIVAVGLPFFATMKLGADRVALIMLVALAADITNVEDETTDLVSSKGWKRLLTHRRWTLASISLQMVCDFMGISTYSSRWELFVGYIALLMSIFLISPPFPSLKLKASPTSSFSTASPASSPKFPATQWETRTWAKPVPGSHRATSPLVCTPGDINLTLAAGTALGLLSCMILFLSTPSAGAVSFADLGLGFLSVCAAAFSYHSVQPHPLRKNSGIGLLFGSMISLGLMTTLRSDTWSYIAYQGILIGVTFAATKLDTLQSLSTSDVHHQAHNPSHHANDNTANHNLPSRFSQSILDSCRKWPLLHSILAEKDSRRIFYFMWCVSPHSIGYCLLIYE